MCLVRPGTELKQAQLLAEGSVASGQTHVDRMAEAVTVGALETSWPRFRSWLPVCVSLGISGSGCRLVELCEDRLHW